MVFSNLSLFIPRRIFKVILLFGLLLFASCDSSFVLDIGSPEAESNRIQTVHQWYTTALEKDQKSIPSLPNVSYKVASDSTIPEILAAMVQQHSPDWDQIEIWDNTNEGVCRRYAS